MQHPSTPSSIYDAPSGAYGRAYLRTWRFS